MKVISIYGVENSPCFEIVSNNRIKCHYCNSNENKHVKFMKKGDKCLRLIFNSGPTGISYICMKHAHKMSRELAEILSSKK